MEVIKLFKKQELSFDNLNNDTNEIIINLYDDTISVNFISIIDTQFSGGNISPSRFKEMKNKFNLGLYSKAPCGGFINFFETKSNYLKNYVIYSGVKEVSNSHYIVTIHAIVRI